VKNVFYTLIKKNVKIGPMEILKEHFEVIEEINTYNRNPYKAAEIYINNKIAPNKRYRLKKDDNYQRMAQAVTLAIEGYRSGNLEILPDDGWNKDFICDSCADETCYRKSRRMQEIRQNFF